MKKRILQTGRKRAAAVSAPKARVKPAQSTRPAAAAPVFDAAAVMAELGAIKALLAASPPAAASPAEALEAGADAIRRVLSETIERHNETIIKELSDALGSLADRDADGAVRRLDSLLAKLGAVRFGADRLDFFDPLIHAAVREDSLADVPDGVVTATLRPGCKTGRGVIAAKARVAVNRRR